MLVSVFTPSHRPRYLDRCYASLQAQTHADWEWVVLLNGGADWRPKGRDDRVRVVRERGVRGVGAAKRAACAHASGDFLVELDHDDVLASDCLETLAQAFAAEPEAVFVYSDWAQINEDGSRNDERFDESNGWVYDEVEVDGQSYLRCGALEASPHNLGYIWFCPNHVRAFRRSAYDEVGGYDAALEILDDQELMIRLYQAGEFRHVSRCLYLQRVHRASTQVRPKTNAAIQTETVALYQRSIVALTRAWCRRSGLAEIALRVPGTIPPDDERAPQVVVVDPDNPALPYPAGTVGAIHAVEVLQHVYDRAAFFNECHRALAHGGLVFTQTPSTDGRGAFQDPSHVSWWNENSFWYLTQRALRPALPDLTARLQVSHLRTYHPSSWHEQVQVPYVQANLLALKDGPRQGGPLLT